MKNTRANSAAAKTPTTAAPNPANEQVVTEPANPRPLANAAPLLLRLEHSIRFANDETHELQPNIGASAVVGDSLSGRNFSGTRTGWLTAAAWQGLAVLIRQTPDWRREDVAAFLDVVTSAVHDSAIAGLLAEAVCEVRHDPYKDVPESAAHEYDFSWT
jgi:hypothetical protein